MTQGTQAQSDPHFKDKVDRLKQIALFKEIAENDVAMAGIANLFKTVSIPAGQPVIKEGDFGEELYIIKAGTVEIEKQTRLGDQYTITELSAQMNIFFGELALVDPDKRSATVLCKTDCEFYVLKREDFFKHGDVDPKVALRVTREISKILCQRLRKANTDMMTLFDALVDEVEESGGISH